MNTFPTPGQALAQAERKLSNDTDSLRHTILRVIANAHRNSIVEGVNVYAADYTEFSLIIVKNELKEKGWSVSQVGDWLHISPANLRETVDNRE